MVVIIKERVVIPFSFFLGFVLCILKLPCKSLCGLLLVVPTCMYAVPVTVLLVGLPKEKQLNLDI